MNWSRLWSSSFESPPCCLCWRPDGRALAVGHLDGSVSILDVEDGSIQHRTPAALHSGAVACMGWADGTAVLHGARSASLDPAGPLDRAAALFPEDAAEPPPASAEEAGPYTDLYTQATSAGAAAADVSSRPPPPGPQPLSILCSADESGLVWLHLCGTQPLLHLRIRERGPQQAAKAATLAPVKLELSCDMRLLYVLSYGKDLGLELSSWEIPELAQHPVEALVAGHQLQQAARLLQGRCRGWRERGLRRLHLVFRHAVFNFAVALNPPLLHLTAASESMSLAEKSLQLARETFRAGMDTLGKLLIGETRLSSLHSVASGACMGRAGLAIHGSRSTTCW